jgi:uncharacterized membrane protein (DUF373 family)
MQFREELTVARAEWKLLTFYQKFEHAIIVILSTLIAVVIIFAVWNLALKIIGTILLSGRFDPTEYAVFQAIFGMIFTVIIAVEFKRSLLVVAERHNSIVQVRTVILLALLAIVRKLLILDISPENSQQLFALAAAIFALGGVYWLVREQDCRERAGEREATTGKQ